MLFKCYFLQFIIKYHILEENLEFLQQLKFFLPKIGQKWAINLNIFWENSTFRKCYNKPQSIFFILVKTIDDYKLKSFLSST
jgi:hypothetical protein